MASVGPGPMSGVGLAADRFHQISRGNVADYTAAWLRQVEDVVLDLADHMHLAWFAIEFQG